MTFLEVGRLVKAGSSKRLCSVKLGRRNFRQDKHILGKIIFDVHSSSSVHDSKSVSQRMKAL